MTIKFLQTQLRDLGLRTTGSKQVLEARLAAAGKAGSDVVIDMERTPSEDLRDSLQALSSTVENLEIRDDTDLAAAVELRYTKIRQARVLLEKHYGITEIQARLDIEKSNLTYAKSSMERYYVPLHLADKRIEQLMKEYDATVRDRQEESAAQIAGQLKERAQTSIISRANKLIESGDDEAGAALLDTLSGVDERLKQTLPTMEVESPQVEGVTFVQLKTYEVTDLSAVKDLYLKPREVDGVKIRKVIHRMDASAAELEVGGIRVFTKPSVREGVRRFSERHEVENNV